MKTPTGFWFIAAIAAVGGGLLAGYWHFSVILPHPADAGAPAAATTASQETVPTNEGTQPQAEAQVEAVVPSFELLRVEPDGSAVIAGMAAPGSQVVLRRGDDVLARETAGAGGDFAFALAAVLDVGEHQLRLETETVEGTLSASRETALVSIPPRGRESELLVMLEEPGAPSRVVAAPEPDLTTPVAEVAAPAPGETALLAAGGPDVPGLADTSLAIRAVEIERDRLYVAGISRPGSTVRLYVDDVFVTEAKGTGGEEFLASALADVAVGDHIVRIDELAEDGSVIARVEVPFQRPEGESVSAVASLLRGAADGAGQGADAAGRQAALEPVEGRVIIRRGDTLWRISRETYGAGSRYTVIYLANGEQIRNPNLIYPGQVFLLPDADG
ncbi:LysM peptidoglycan-binding domain-containing protein [Aureimonas populi]|uniref:LysM peptidoglycan-binding domain-containing protein n=1 Tax=Aureimonas populi TaxID=1701758 RepID=A0ABW5CIP3_9HYPH|nr:LysM peptidoglycan-binding domain-containing protein [Aureimonas populi]